MILADKIIEERKRNGWSQEDLAEKLGVSRQSISKWEGAQSIPDLNRILQMAELFSVSTDYLLKEEVKKEREPASLSESIESVKGLRHVSMEEASDYIRLQEKIAPLVALGVSLCIASPILLLILSGLAESRMFGISENLAVGLGITILLIMVSIAVFIFIQCGSETKKYEFLDTVEIDTAYGVDGMVREKKETFSGKFRLNIAFGVVLCILCSVPLLIGSSLTEEEYVLTAMVSLLLLIVSFAVNRFVNVGIINSSYEKLLQEGDYTPGKKKSAPLINRIAGIYWLVVLAIYLAWSFSTMNWQITWLVWPIAGVLFGAVVIIVKIVIKAED
ncbi:MAG: helix-turn-helix domain-containing protein [Lachnospiraceae bacterium]